MVDRKEQVEDHCTRKGPQKRAGFQNQRRDGKERDVKRKLGIAGRKPSAVLQHQPQDRNAAKAAAMAHDRKRGNAKEDAEKQGGKGRVDVGEPQPPRQ